MASLSEAEDQPPAKKAKFSVVPQSAIGNIDPTPNGDGPPEGPADALDGVFTQLADLQNELDQLDCDAQDRVKQIELELASARRAVYMKRRQCTRDIPDFWGMCLQQHPYLFECMSATDTEILAYLEEVVVDSDPEAVDNPMSFTISLTVADNPYLFAQTVTKTFNHSPELELFRISTSGVKWKPGHEPSAFAGDEDHTPSFFEWFEHEPVLESEYDAAAGALVDQIWPDPVRWYLGDGGEELPNSEALPEEDPTPGFWEQQQIDNSPSQAQLDPTASEWEEMQESGIVGHDEPWPYGQGPGDDNEAGEDDDSLEDDYGDDDGGDVEDEDEGDAAGDDAP